MTPTQERIRAAVFRTIGGILALIVFAVVLWSPVWLSVLLNSPVPFIVGIVGIVVVGGYLLGEGLPR